MSIAGIVITAITAVAGIVLIVLGIRGRRGPDDSRRSPALIIVGVIAVLGAAVLGASLFEPATDEDPGRIRLDWRETITAHQLPGQPTAGDPNRYEYRDGLQLTLPDGTVFTADDTTFTITVDGGTLKAVEGESPSTSWTHATNVMRNWCRQLGFSGSLAGPERPMQFGGTKFGATAVLDLRPGPADGAATQGITSYSFTR